MDRKYGGERGRHAVKATWAGFEKLALFRMAYLLVSQVVLQIFPRGLLQLVRALVECLWLWYETQNLIICIPANIFTWCWPEEFVHPIVMHALHFNAVLLHGHDDARVHIIVILDNTPLSDVPAVNCLWSPWGLFVLLWGCHWNSIQSSNVQLEAGTIQLTILPPTETAYVSVLDLPR